MSDPAVGAGVTHPPDARPAAGTGSPAPVPVLTLLRRPGWIWGLVAVVALAALFVFLGRWQFGRHEGKVVRNTKIDADYAAAAVPLGDLLASPATALPPAVVWRPVRVSGQYEPASTVLVRNRPLDGEYGYEVVVPLRRCWSTGAGSPTAAPAPRRTRCRRRRAGR